MLLSTALQKSGNHLTGLDLGSLSVWDGAPDKPGPGIGLDGGLAVAELLASAGSNLQTVSLSDNQLPAEVGPALGGALAVNRTVLNLDLGGNQLGSAGAIAIAKALEANTALTMLNLESNHIGLEASAGLASALASNTSLVCLDLYNNALQYDGSMEIVRAVLFHNGAALRKLNLAANQIQPDRAEVSAN